MCAYWIRFSFLVSLFISMILKKLSVYSLNFVLCLHLAINLHLLFNNFSGNLYIIICIFSSKHKLHQPSKLFEVFDFFKIDHSISGVNPLFFKHQNCFDSAIWFLGVRGRKYICGLHISPSISWKTNRYKIFIRNILFWVNYCLIYYII